MAIAEHLNMFVPASSQVKAADKLSLAAPAGERTQKVRRENRVAVTSPGDNRNPDKVKRDFAVDTHVLDRQ